MKSKQKTTLAMILLIVLLAGCGKTEAPSQTTDKAEKAYAESVEEIIFETELRRDAFYNRNTNIEPAGTIYYISNSGNDNNDGLSPETAWATLDRAFETYWPLTRNQFKSGDTILLERGGTWYVSPDEREGLTSDAYNIIEGVTLGAYGEGIRPVIRGDIKEANDSSLWTLYYDENGIKIWSFSNKLQDSNVIVFNKGEAYGEEVMPYWSTILNNYSNADGKLFDIATELKNNLSFCCMLDLDNGENVDLSNSTAKGTLYLRCDEGNPAKVFDEVAIPQAQTGLILHSDATLADIDIRYFTCIAVEMSGYDGNSGQEVLNCEVSWCGGLLHEYQYNKECPDGTLKP